MAVLVQINIVTGVKVHISGPNFTIGRDEENGLCIDDDLASRNHAVIESVGGPDSETVTWLLRDLGSTNGTYVKDQRITVHALTEGDVIRIGKTFLKFHAHDHAELGETRVIRRTIIPGFYYVTDKQAR